MIPLIISKKSVKIGKITFGNLEKESKYFFSQLTKFQSCKKKPLNSYREVLYVILTEPQSSTYAAIYFILSMVVILTSTIIMIGQTCPGWTYIPTTCELCSEDSSPPADIPCVCEPMPLPVTENLMLICMILLAIEWILRVICYAPNIHFNSSSEQQQDVEEEELTCFQKIKRWAKILTWPSTITDALAVFPYFLERFFDMKGLLALRLLRLFRLSFLFRIRAFSLLLEVIFRVLLRSLITLYILFSGLLFGAVFFGSFIYFFEMGEWKYTTYTDPPSYRFMRLSVDHMHEEPSPFESIPSSFWWFMVTATSVGYGDIFPTTIAGKCVAVFAMSLGVFVIAFPTAVFVELLSDELEKKSYFTLGGDNDDAPVNSVSQPSSQEIFSKDRSCSALHDDISSNSSSDNDDSITSDHIDDYAIPLPSIEEEESDIQGRQHTQKSQNLHLNKTEFSNLMSHFTAMQYHEEAICKLRTQVKEILDKSNYFET